MDQFDQTLTYIIGHWWLAAAIMAWTGIASYEIGRAVVYWKYRRVMAQLQLTNEQLVAITGQDQTKNEKQIKSLANVQAQSDEPDCYEFAAARKDLSTPQPTATTET